MIALKAIRDRLNAATPGEWHSYANTVPVGYAKGNDVRVGLDNFICRDASCADMEFIANAKQDIAALIEAVEEYEDIFDEISELLRAHPNQPDGWVVGQGKAINALFQAPKLRRMLILHKQARALSAKDKGEENG